MSFISIELNLNHIFFLLIFIAYFIRFYLMDQIKSDEIKKRASIKFFNMFIYTLSNLFSGILFCIVKIRSKRRNKILKKDSKKKQKKESKASSKSLKSLDIELIYEKESPVNRCKLLIRTLMVAITDLAAQYFVFIFYIFVNFDGKGVKFDSILIFNILSKYLFSRLILNTNYYRHHNLSFLINLVGLILISITDIMSMIKNWSVSIIYFIFINIFCTICYSLEDVIGKKALIEEFLSPYSILFYKGVYEIILLLIGTIPFLFIKIEGEYIFYIFGEMLDSLEKIFLVFLLMLFNFIYNLFIWIINDRFSPNDLAITILIEGITDKLDFLVFKFREFENNLFVSVYEIIIYFILVIGALIHNEIVIINWCGLDEYTKKNINKKSTEDFNIANRRTTTESTINFEDERESKDINDKIYDRDTISTELSVIPSQEPNS